MKDENNEEVRSLTCDEVPLLRPCLEGLAAYHNRVAVSFSGVYPTMPVDTHLAHMKDHVANDTARIVGLFLQDGTLGGFGMSSYEGSYGEVDYLFVHKSLRGEGRGRQILALLMDYLKEKKVAFVDLKVVLGNPAKRFYEKCGFATRSEVMSMHL